MLSEVGPFDVSEGIERLEGGCLCYAAYFDQRLAHFSWVRRSGTHQIVEAGTSAPVENGDFWIFNCITADWARGKGIYPATLDLILRDHFDAGYRTAWIYADKTNIASQRGIIKAGFSPTRRYTALRFGTYYHPLRSSSYTLIPR